MIRNSEVEIKPSLTGAERLRNIHYKALLGMIYVGNGALIYTSVSHSAPLEYKFPIMFGILGLDLLAVTHYRLIWKHFR